ncbi:hypothetical protein D7V86_14750 [bacterium D16-51]|nr:hypothetical protein D7V96_02035 [bacterium D16-59]RKI58817.1 hypothetical protein D7V86_14750 [bacterium D16-51]
MLCNSCRQPLHYSAISYHIKKGTASAGALAKSFAFCRRTTTITAISYHTKKRTEISPL